MKKKMSDRDACVENGVMLASADTLAAALLSLNHFRDLAWGRLMEMIRLGLVDAAKIDAWITIFTDQGVAKEYNIKSLWEVLEAAKHCFTPEQVLRFYCAVCNGRWTSLSDSVQEKFYSHPLVNEQHILSAIRETTRHRSDLFQKLVERKTSLEVFLECLPYEKIGASAIERIGSFPQPKDSSDRESAKEKLLAALKWSATRDGAFAVLCDWGLLSQKELENLSTQDGTKHLARRALKKK